MAEQVRPSGHGARASCFERVTVEPLPIDARCREEVDDDDMTALPRNET